MKHIACSKIWTDINLNIPTKEIRNCCKKQPAKLSVDDLKSLGIDSFTKHQVLVEDKQFVIDNNELPAGCYYCKSTWPNAIWNNWNVWKNKEWSPEELTDLPSKDYVRQIEIMLGITCNQTCMYCTPEVSSAWANLKQIPIVTDNDWQDTALKNLYGYIETNRCNDSNYLWYNFLGGEPLLEPKIFKVIESIIDIHNKNFVKDKKIVFNMTTNLNVKPKTIDRYIELVERNPNFEWTMSTSLDAIGSQGEEIRDGLSFENFESNLHKIFASKKFKTINLLPAVSALSIPGKHKLLSWYFDVALTYNTPSSYGPVWSVGTNVVTWPTAMHPGILPSSYTEEIDKCLEVVDSYNFPEHDIKNYKTHLNNLKGMIGTRREDNNLAEAKQWYQNEGSLKNKDYFTIFPFLKELLKY